MWNCVQCTYLNSALDDQCNVCEWRSEPPSSSSSSSALEGNNTSCLISVQQTSGGDFSAKNEELFSIFSRASRLREVEDVASSLDPPTHNSSDSSVEIATASRNGITGGAMAFKECPVCTLLSSVEVEVCAVCDHSFKRKAEKREGTTANISSRKTTKCDSTITPEQYFNLLKSRLGDVKFRVCSALHFISQTEDVSSSKWACGYRNIQMLCSSLVQCDAFSSTRLLAAWNSKRLCSVEGVQQLIIEAWREGYDTAGADDMNRCLNKKWIGATGFLLLFYVKKEL